MATRDPKQHSSGANTARYGGKNTPATDSAAQSAGARFSVITSWVSAVALAVVFAIGGWQRRWISDDGLIVLRTVRNLLAGNGPVFNAGERVEANTSVVWQYIIYVIAAVSSARLETIAIYTGLVFSVLAIAIAALGSAALHRSPGVLFVPCGLLLYICLPPARDFATSGLEWGLSIFWIAVLWFLMVYWNNARGRRAPHSATRDHHGVLRDTARALRHQNRWRFHARTHVASPPIRPGHTHRHCPHPLRACVIRTSTTPDS